MKSKYSFAISLLAMVVSFVSLVLIILSKENNDYSLLWMLPLSYLLCSILFNKVFYLIPRNFGVTLLLFLELFRLTILPVVFAYGDYTSNYSGISDSYGNKAILLMVFEVIAIFVTIFLCMRSKRIKRKASLHEETYFYSTRVFSRLIICLIIAFVITIIIAPEGLLLYKNPFSIMDVNFTSTEGETYNVVSRYSTTFIKKLALVLHVYLMKILRFIVPLQIIVKIYNGDSNKRRFPLCIIISLLSLLIIDGSLARSLLYCLVLMYVSAFIYRKETKIYKYLSIASLAVAAYFILRMTLVNSQLNHSAYFSKVLNAYFSGVPNTAGTIKLTFEPGELIKYFFCDYFQSVPFGNTIFGVSDVSFQNYFNTFNHTYGQIPTTIGVGYLYFGAAFAPLYSILFSYLTYKFGLLASESKNILRKGVLFFASLTCAMGIVMYYLQISFASLGTFVFPILIISLIARRRQKKKAGVIDEK